MKLNELVDASEEEEVETEETFDEVENDLHDALDLLVDSFIILEEIIVDKNGKKLPPKMFKKAKTLAQEILCFTSQWPDAEGDD